MDLRLLFPYYERCCLASCFNAAESLLYYHFHCACFSCPKAVLLRVPVQMLCQNLCRQLPMPCLIELAPRVCVCLLSLYVVLSSLLCSLFFVLLLAPPEINYLVYRYLQESGFVHSAFTFAYESLISQSVVATQAGGDVAPGTLVAFLQKGLQLVAMEQRLNDDGSERAGADHEDFSLLTVCCVDARERFRLHNCGSSTPFSRVLRHVCDHVVHLV